MTVKSGPRDPRPQIEACSVVSMPVNVADTLDPSSVTVTKTARAMRPSIMAYSARSCPDSSFHILSSVFIVPPFHSGVAATGVASMTVIEAPGMPNGRFMRIP